MIKLNGKKITIGKFPDNTCLLKIEHPTMVFCIDWLYEGDEEMAVLYFLTKHLNNLGIKKLSLNIPYIPNARMDRVKSNEEVFTLKYFADFINSLNFSSVIVFDPHSYVSEALINNIRFMNVPLIINKAIESFEPDFLFFPDEGAMKRYSKLFETPFIYGQKDRDWKTGEIKGLNVIGEIKKDAKILIVDDICSFGGTFLHSARKLKEIGAGDIALYVSHCEDSILRGELINSGLLKKIYTTNSIFTEKHELIEIVHSFIRR